MPLRKDLALFQYFVKFTFMWKFFDWTEAPTHQNATDDILKKAQQHKMKNAFSVKLYLAGQLYCSQLHDTDLKIASHAWIALCLLAQSAWPTCQAQPLGLGPCRTGERKMFRSQEQRLPCSLSFSNKQVAQALHKKKVCKAVGLQDQTSREGLQKSHEKNWGEKSPANGVRTKTFG